MSLLLSSNAEYHADRTHLSSTGLKTLLKDPAAFYAEYVLGESDRAEKSFFDEGSFVHSLILEPEKVAIDYAIFSGLRKQGTAWEDFKYQNAGKKILSLPQVTRCEALLKAYNALPAALEIMKGTLPEHPMVAVLKDTAVKARADAINVAEGYLVDVKTTSMESDIGCFSATVEQYLYQLSASLYCSIAENTYKRPFDFYWLVLSKADQGCEIYKASAATLLQGSIMVNAALALHKKCLETGIWKLEQKPSRLNNLNYEILEV